MTVRVLGTFENVGDVRDLGRIWEEYIGEKAHVTKWPCVVGGGIYRDVYAGYDA